jgi:ubiquinone/menaquinone biosynthesis C-methylase UbiE
MDICEYLKNENRMESQEGIAEIIDRLPKDVREQFEKLDEEFCDANIPENIKKFYDFITENRFWDVMENTFYDRNKRIMPLVSQDISGKCVLDVGCGTGLKTVFYALNHPDKEFIGFDISTASLSEATRRKEKYGVKNLELLEMNMQEIHLDKKFDVILADRVIHESHALDMFRGQYDVQYHRHLKSLGSVLHPEGKILVLLCPSEVSGFAQYFNSYLECVGLKMQKHKCLDFQRFGDIGTDIYFHLKRA